MRKVFDTILIALFVTTLVGGGIATYLLPKQKVSATEKRKLADFPKLRWRHLNDFTSQFESFASDHMPGRTALVSARNLLKYACWGVSGSPSVLAGRNGWLYYLGDYSAVVFRHELPYSEAELKQWKLGLEARTALLAKHDIKYMFVVAPDKPTVYPEFLPDGFQPVRSQSRMDQLTAYLKDDPKIAFVNLSQPLRAAKGSVPLYFKTDTHWNHLGAYVGYRQIMSVASVWFPMLVPLADSNVKFVDASYKLGDCASMMGVLGVVTEKAPLVKSTNEGRLAGLKQIPRVLVLEDSFGQGLQPFFRATFPNIKFRHQVDISCDFDAIIAEKPDLVIQELVERRVAFLVPYFNNDWRAWVAQTMGKYGGKNVFLSVVPSTPEINVVRLSSYKPLQQLNVRTFTCRKWQPAGDQIEFDPKEASYAQWYLLKAGDTGERLIDAASQKAYKQLISFVQSSGKYNRVAELKLSDGSTVELYKQI